MTKDELIQEAKKLGLKVKGHWADDIGENLIIGACFFAAGWFISNLF